MGVLTIDEGGEQRAFRVSDGLLTVGSGKDADVLLSSEDVAELHAELEFEGDALYVLPRPGVVPPSVHGVALKKKTRLGPGQELRIGRARLVWRLGEDVAAPPTARAGTSAQPSPERVQKGRSGRGRKGGQASRRRSVKTRSGGRKRSPAGIPSWIIVVGILAAVAGAAFFLMRAMSGDMEQADKSSAQFHLRKATELMQSRNTDAAQGHLDKIALSSLNPADRTRFTAVEDSIAEELAEINLIRANNLGSTWFKFNLEDYEERYLSGDPELAKVRLFLERCAEFRQSWPQHPHLNWVERQSRRFEHFPGLDDPLGYDDFEWRAKVLTNARPRNYRRALAMLNEYRKSAQNSRERIGVDQLVAELEADRIEYHKAQLQQARGEYEKGNVSRAVEWLVQSILGLGDKVMEDEAAQILVKFPSAKSVLLGYRESRAEDFERLKGNEVIASFLAR